MTSQVTAVPRVVRDQLMTDAVFDQFVVPYLSNPRKREMNDESQRIDQTGRDVDEFDAFEERFPGATALFEEAHKIAELFFALASLSACNKYYRDKLKPKKKELADRIINLLSLVPRTEWGSPGRYVIYYGRYLDVLKIHFYYKPETLLYRGGPDGSEETSRLNEAVFPATDKYRSLSFIAVVLERDKELVKCGRKSLLLVPDRHGQLAVEHLIRQETEPVLIYHCSQNYHYRLLPFENGAQVKKMLLKHAEDIGLTKESIGVKEKETVKAQAPDKKPAVVTKTKESTTNVDKPKAQPIPEKKKSSFCSSLYKAFMYVVTCQWVFDFIKFLKK